MSQAPRRLLLSFLAAGLCLAAAACHDKPKAAPESPQVAVVAPKPAAVLPQRLPGLWQTTVTEAGSEDAPQSLQLCLDARTDQHLGILGTDLSGDTCKRTLSKTAEGWELLAECNMGSGGVNEFSGSIAGDYTQDYSMKLRLQTTRASLPQMNRVTSYVVQSKRMGDCARDQQPGDVINDGIKLNLFDMAGMTQRAPVSAEAPPEPKDVVD